MCGLPFRGEFTRVDKDPPPDGGGMVLATSKRTQDKELRLGGCGGRRRVPPRRSPRSQWGGVGWGARRGPGIIIRNFNQKSDFRLGRIAGNRDIPIPENGWTKEKKS